MNSAPTRDRGIFRATYLNARVALIAFFSTFVRYNNASTARASGFGQEAARSLTFCTSATLDSSATLHWALTEALAGYRRASSIYRRAHEPFEALSSRYQCKPHSPFPFLFFRYAFPLVRIVTEPQRGCEHHFHDKHQPTRPDTPFFHPRWEPDLPGKWMQRPFYSSRAQCQARRRREEYRSWIIIKVSRKLFSSLLVIRANSFFLTYQFHIAQHPTHSKNRYARVSSSSSAPHVCRVFFSFSRATSRLILISFQTPSPVVKREQNSLLNVLDAASPFGAPNATPSDKPLLAARRRSGLVRSSPAQAAVKINRNLSRPSCLSKGCMIRASPTLRAQPLFPLAPVLLL